jgi:pyridinium-3,5-bisthiocarboxylic acid mononucleotide nickel chelatase
MLVAYLDGFSGISGDMTLAALVDAGASAEQVQKGVQSLGLGEVRLRFEPTRRGSFRALKLHVEHPPEHAHRHLHHIERLIDHAELTSGARELALAMFRRLAEAEAEVHGVSVAKVHFHEVGAIDSIVDIVGTAVAWDSLGIVDAVCSPLPTGCGEVRIAHGLVRIPAPATARLLRGVPLASCDEPYELTTPTGATIATTLASRFGPLPAMTIERIGCGAGSLELQGRANLLRVLIGRQSASRRSVQHDQVGLLETQLDDLDPQQFAFAVEQLWAAKPLDLFSTPIQMKKGRHGWLLTVLCLPEQMPIFEQLMFVHCHTLGIRRQIVERSTLERQPISVATALGPVSGKLIRLPTGEERFAPEYEDCQRLASEHEQPLYRIRRLAQSAWDESNRPRLAAASAPEPMPGNEPDEAND